jgi:hypothetical protein
MNRDREYGTSRQNPGFVFRLSGLAYNPNLRYYYRDLNVPKKKLTPEELLEVNRLYRVIGACNTDLRALGVTPVFD